METKPILSICVPTFNRESLFAACLGELVNQVLALEDRGLVEILVSNNASTDGTAAVARGFAGLYGGLRYNENAEDLGPIENFLLLIKMARGSYFWLVGDDDLVKPGALKKILEILVKNPRPDLFYVNYEQKGSEGQKKINLPEDMFFETGRDYVRYGLEHFSSNEWDVAKFTFITSLIIRKERWDAVPEKERFMKTAAPHAYVIFSFLPARPLYLISESMALQNNAPYRDTDEIQAATLYKEWLRIFWFIGKQCGYRLAFARLVAWNYLVYKKERLKAAHPAVNKMLGLLETALRKAFGRGAAPRKN